MHASSKPVLCPLGARRAVLRLAVTIGVEHQVGEPVSFSVSGFDILCMYFLLGHVSPQSRAPSPSVSFSIFSAPIDRSDNTTAACPKSCRIGSRGCPDARSGRVSTTADARSGTAQHTQDPGDEAIHQVK